MPSLSPETRRCGRCKQSKPLEEFAWRRRERGQRHNYCRPCQKDYRRAHYLAHRRKYIEKASRRRQRLVRERTAFLVSFFAQHPCVDCGERDPLVLEFDHLKDKEFDIGADFINRRWTAILEEIKKCDVVCANCHRRRTARRGGFMKLAFIEHGSD